MYRPLYTSSVDKEKRAMDSTGITSNSTGITSNWTSADMCADAVSAHGADDEKVNELLPIKEPVIAEVK
jgi:hypothetical protein